MIRLICLLIGYAFGLIQTAYIYGKSKGIDIREQGSGNAGTTNALRVFGRKAGLLVFAGDFFKCILAIVVAKLLFINNYADMKYLLYMYTAAGCILGHNYPFYMGFKGGKGIAATAGLIASIHPYLIPLGLLAFFGTFFITHYVSLGSLLVYAGLFAEVIIFGELGVFEGLTRAQLYELYVLTFLLAVMAYWKHKDNIVRLMQGTERKTYLSKKNRE